MPRNGLNSHIWSWCKIPVSPNVCDKRHDWNQDGCFIFVCLTQLCDFMRTKTWVQDEQGQSEVNTLSQLIMFSQQFYQYLSEPTVVKGWLLLSGGLLNVTASWSHNIFWLEAQLSVFSKWEKLNLSHQKRSFFDLFDPITINFCSFIRCSTSALMHNCIIVLTHPV